MNDFRTKLTLEGADFNQTLNDAQQEVNEFKKSTEDASKSVDDMSKSTKRSASELLKQMKTMEGLGRSTSNYRQQLSQMTRDIQDLSINYAKMSDEMKNSDFGREVASQIQDMTKQAAEYRDAIQDATQATRLLASDTSNLDAAKSAIEGLSAGMQLFASVGILGEENTEKVIKALAKLKAIESATNAVIAIANVLNKDSILMLKIKAMQTRLATKAQTEYTAATGAATVAQRIFNTVAKSNPYVLLATAILAVVGAMVLFTRETEEATETLDGYVSLADKTRKTQNDLAQAYGQTAGKLKATYIQLREQWNLLKTDMEKNKFIQDNADKFKEMGIAINGVNDAEQAFTEYNSVILKSFDLRAKAAAAAAVAAKRYQEALELRQQVKNEESTHPYKVGDVVPTDLPSSDRAYYGRRRTDKRGNEVGDYEFDETGLSLYYADKKMEAFRLEQEGLDLYKQEAELQQELNDLIAENTILQQENNNVRGNGNGGGNNKETYDKGSVADYDAAIQELNNALKNRNLTEQETLDIMKEIVKLESKRAELVKEQDYAKIMASPIPTLNPISTKKALEDAFKKDPVKIPATLYLDEKQYTFLDLNNGISDAISGFGQLNSAVSSVDNAISSMAQGWDENKTAIGNVTTQIGNVLTIMQSVCTVIDTMNKLSTIFDGLQAIGLNLEQQKNTEKKKGIILTMAESYQQARATGLSVVEAIATAIKSASEIPMVGWAIGLAAAASVIALIASAPKFAKGGIVPGSSFSGDKITAQVNSGEMILNRRQQAKLFDMLDSSSSVGNGGGRVEFVIKGQELKGVLNNYDKKMSRI